MAHTITSQTMPATTSSTVAAWKPHKHFGWCEEQSVEHNWKDGPTLTVNPPIATRRCENCGRTERFNPGYWD